MDVDLPTSTSSSTPPFSKKLRATAANGPLMIVLAGIVVTSCTSTIFNKALVYYFKYVLADARLASIALSFMAIIVGLSVPVWGMVATRFSKRISWLSGMVPTLVGIILWRIVDGRDMVFLFAALGLIALGTGASVTSYWAMLPDTVEFAEWHSGIRSESFGYGLVAFGQKVAFGVGGGLLGLWLSNIGYVADAAQSAQTLAQIKSIVFLTPLTGVILTGALIAFYPLSPMLHGRMVAEIAARQSAQ